MFRKRALNRLKLHAYPVDATAAETIIRCTKPPKPHAKPLGFSGRISRMRDQMRPKETKNMSISRLFVWCRTGSASFFLQYPISNSINGCQWLCATLLLVACDVVAGRMRPYCWHVPSIFLKIDQTQSTSILLSPNQHHIPWTGPQLTGVDKAWTYSNGGSSLTSRIHQLEGSENQQISDSTVNNSDKITVPIFF